MINCDLQPCDVGYCCQTCSYTSRRKTKRNCAVANNGLEGLGDIVAAFAKSLGFKKCGGCAERQKLLNKWAPSFTGRRD